MRLATVIAALAIAPPAFASTHVETEEEKHDDVVVTAAAHDPYTEYSVAFRIGSFHTGPVYNFATGFSVEGGLRMDELALLGEYDFIGLLDPPTSASQTTTAAGGPQVVPDSSHPTGYAHRIGALARWSPARFVDAYGGVGARGDFWIEGGLGEELIEWTGGGYLHRPDLALGVGWQIGARGEHKHGGMIMMFRAILMPAPQPVPSGPPTCAGPCDGPTRPGSSVDHAFLFGIGFHFGG